MVSKIASVKFDFPMLKAICHAEIEQFSSMTIAELCAAGYGGLATDSAKNPLLSGWGTVNQMKYGRYIYRNNGADVLAIAHLDSVAGGKYFDVVNRDAQGCICYAPQLDDRLGAYIIACLLPKLGVKCDVLLTEGEEHGASTGADFEPPADKQYNWMFQFDRTGADVVMYQYDTPANRELLRTVGLVPANGLFSDIAMMEHLGISGFNVGCAYVNYHGLWASFDVNVCIGQIVKFVEFYNRYHATPLPFAPEAKAVRRGSTALWQDDVYIYSGKHETREYCDVCGRRCKTKEDRQCHDWSGLCTVCYQKFERVEWQGCDVCDQRIKANTIEQMCFSEFKMCTECYASVYGTEYTADWLDADEVADDDTAATPPQSDPPFVTYSSCDDCGRVLPARELYESHGKRYCERCVFDREPRDDAQ